MSITEAIKNAFTAKIYGVNLFSVVLIVDVILVLIFELISIKKKKSNRWILPFIIIVGYCEMIIISTLLLLGEI